MTQIEQALEVLNREHSHLAKYVKEMYDALNEVTNDFMPGEGSGCYSRGVPDCLVRAAAVLCDISLDK